MEIFGETIRVNAAVSQLNGVSGHADNEGLIRWIGAVRGVKRVFVVHGEDGVTDLFASRLRDELGLIASAPYPGEQWDLQADRMTAPGNSAPVRKEAAPAETGEEAAEDNAGETAEKDGDPADPSFGNVEEQYRELGKRIKNAKSRRERNKWASEIRKLIKKMR